MSDHLRKKQENFPWHASAKDSLELEMFTPPDQMLAYSEAFTVHATDELPMLLFETQFFEFSGGKRLEILIEPSVIRSERNLKALESSERLCYFEGERKLRYFKVYTKHNCEIECYSNFTQKFNYSSYDIIHDHNISYLEDEYDVDSEEYEYFRKLDSAFMEMRPTPELIACSCFSPCDSTSYSFEIRESKLREDE